MKRIVYLFCSLLFLILTAVSIDAFADTTASVAGTKTLEEDGRVKIYVRDFDVSGGMEYQIGNTPVDDIDTYHISEDKEPIRTLIMTDNSRSIPQKNRQSVLDAMNTIVDAHSENELFKVAIFSETLTYLSTDFSDDYSSIHDIIDSIEFQNQDTMLTDVLYGVIEDLNKEDFKGFTRIIIFGDGVNDKPLGGVTYDRIKEVLKKTPYTIYAFGCDTGNNEKLLDNLSDLTWLTGGEFGIIGKVETEEIAAITSRDNSITVIDAVIDKSLQTGGKQSSKLTLGDGTVLSFEIDIPFSLKEEVEEEKEPEPQIIIERVIEKEPETEVIPEPPKKKAPIILILSIIFIVLAAAGIAVYFIILNKKKKEEQLKKEYMDSLDFDVIPGCEETVAIDVFDTSQNENVEIYGPPTAFGESVVKENKYTVSLVDTEDNSRFFSCDFADSASVGRRPENDLVIHDDNAVHGEHCTINSKAGVFFLTDCGHVKNHTQVNGVEIQPEIPQLLVQNSAVTIGRHSYTVNIKEKI